MKNTIINSLPEVEEYFEILERDKSEHTVRSYRGGVILFLEYFKIDSFDKINKLNLKDMRSFQTNLMNTGMTNASVNGRLRVVNAFLNFFVDNEMLDKNPAEKLKNLKEESKVPEILTDEEVKAMVGSMDTLEGKLIIALMYATGVRREELIKIKRSDISNQHVLINGKGRKQRKLFIQDDVFELLNEYLSTHNSEWVFPSNKKNGSITTETVRLRVKKAAELAGIEEKRIKNLSCHSIRRSFATSLLNSGVDNFIVRDTLGHKSSSTTARYAKVNSHSVDQVLANRTFRIA
jgi:integrase/recombinase XerD